MMASSDTDAGNYKECGRPSSDIDCDYTPDPVEYVPAGQRLQASDEFAPVTPNTSNIGVDGERPDPFRSGRGLVARADFYPQKPCH